MQADPADQPDAGQRCKRLRSSSHEESRPPPPYPVKAAVARLLRQVFSSKGPVRDMDFVELFAGEAVVSEGTRAFGYRGWTCLPVLKDWHQTATRLGIRRHKANTEAIAVLVHRPLAKEKCGWHVQDGALDDRGVVDLAGNGGMANQGQDGHPRTQNGHP